MIRSLCKFVYSLTLGMIIFLLARISIREYFVCTIFGKKVTADNIGGIFSNFQLESSHV